MRYAWSKTSFLVQTLTPHQCNASCKGKCFSSFTCRNYLRSPPSARGLEVLKKSNLPVGQGCPSLPERCLEGYQYKNSMHLEHDEMQCKTEVTNTLRTRLSSQKYFQKWFKMQPQGVQMASKIHSGSLLGSQAEKNRFRKASRTPQGPPLGGYLGGQNRSKAVMEALPTRN